MFVKFVQSSLEKFVFRSVCRHRQADRQEDRQAEHPGKRSRRSAEKRGELPREAGAASRAEEPKRPDEDRVRPAEHPAAEEAADRCCAAVDVLLPGSRWRTHTQTHTCLPVNLCVCLSSHPSVPVNLSVSWTLHRDTSLWSFLSR